MRKLFSLAAATAVLSSVAVFSAVSAMASPGNCDPTTPDGYLNCFGGGPWQNQDGSSPDTYGALGPRGFLAENRKMGVLPRVSDANLVRLGGAICSLRANGVTESGIESMLVEAGVSDSDAQVLLVNAGFLCSPNGTPRN